MRIALLAALSILPSLASAAPTDVREFEFTYKAEIAPPADGAPLEVFLPLAHSDEHQEVTVQSVASPYLKLEEKTERRFGNRYLHGTLDGRIPLGHEGPFTVEVKYRVSRAVHRNVPGSAPKGARLDSERNLDLFLKPDRRVPVSGPLVDKMIADLAFKPTEDQAARAKRIYDFVVDTMEYKKVGKGWGQGDTEWACSQKYGNCTDFHALFSSLARHEGIPSRFEIGFSVPEDKKEGEIGGYHCWVNFYLPGQGWVPIDASEAKKNPGKRELLFGTHPADRIKFTVGRDLRLGAAQKGQPLNFFVYPYVEKGGAPYDGVKTSFGFREI